MDDQRQHLTLNHYLDGTIKCLDCEWWVNGPDGWMACKAVEHATATGHRVEHQDSVTLVAEDQLPAHDHEEADRD